MHIFNYSKLLSFSERFLCSIVIILTHNIVDTGKENMSFLIKQYLKN